MITLILSPDYGTVTLSLAATLGLIVLLAVRELAGTTKSEYRDVFRRNLLMFSVPLAALFACIAAITLIRWLVD